MIFKNKFDKVVVGLNLFFVYLSLFLAWFVVYLEPLTYGRGLLIFIYFFIIWIFVPLLNIYLVIKSFYNIYYFIYKKSLLLYFWKDLLVLFTALLIFYWHFKYPPMWPSLVGGKIYLIITGQAVTVI